MKVNDKKDTIIGCIILIIICAGVYFFNRRETEHIASKPMYAIGLYTDYMPGGGGMYGTTTPSVKVMFIVNNKLIEVKPRVSRQSDPKDVGRKFLVVYYKDNPTECLLLYDYPIEDSTDFKRYLEEFKTKPSDISKYF